MTAGDLHDALARLGADLMARALAALERGSLAFTPQPEEGVTYAAKISKDETRIDWAKPWRDVHNHIRGLSPFPGAWFELGGARVKALRSTPGEGSGAPGTVLDDKLTVACGAGSVRLTQVQRAGKQPMDARGFPARHAGERRNADSAELSSPRKRGPSTPCAIDRLRSTGSRPSLRSAGTTTECRATSSSSNMTARPLPAGRSRPKA